ncbi:MAG: ribonuclease J, partial [Erysipelothrix sp.]|nr:ribonuclease J [Erysipelothrix sp.]
MSNLLTNTKKQNLKNVLPTGIEAQSGDTLIYALGGLNEVGKNMYCFEHDDEIIVVDAGVMFPGENLLGVDYVIPDYTYLVRNAKKFKALVITHGHEDHIGGIPFLLQLVKPEKIYAPQFAKSLIERKFKEHRIVNTKIELIDHDSKIQTKHFVIGFFNTIHSIPDSLGVLINTVNGRIVETGDFKFDLTPVGTNSDYQKIAFMGSSGIDLLMSDSTNSSVEGFSISEKQVAQSLMEIFTRNNSTRIIVATFASNVYRVKQIIEAAIKNDRKIAIFGRSMERMVEIALKHNYFDFNSSSFIKANQLIHTPAAETCIICTGSQGEALAALSRIANGTHRQVKVHPGDTVIFSSNPIPGNTEKVSGVVNKL